jgi:hypothetical protein
MKDPPKHEILSSLLDQFNESNDSIRIVAILSNSCKDCHSGYKDLARIFERFGSSGKLKEMIIWHPSSPSGVESSISFIPDESGELASIFAKALALSEEKALHVYLLYPPRIRWEGEDQVPPPPAFWMHQSSSLDEKQIFDPARFEEETKFLIDAEDPEFSDRQVPEVLLNKKKDSG